ncbi:uncharacterized protein LOC128760974 isoform X2 [Synchiropus splendidus]|uniref:uncharacterized protein LOC128760974 isoform X2 n=1 Tax=Synchiropus splendidus TaxID=270530 RepID=UPI00237E9637|nr:uncharacterized protein LOC128760974 isoform X2 [Synchiropus splendidus]
MGKDGGEGGGANRCAFKWTKEQTEVFIRLRAKHSALFTGGRDTAANGYRTILEEMGLVGKISNLQAKKKWDNLKMKYKECKCPPKGWGSEDVLPTPATWPWFDLMDQALGQGSSLMPVCLIASIPEDTPGLRSVQPAEQAEAEGEEEEEEDGKEEAEVKEEEEERGSGSSSSRNSLAPRGRKRRWEEDPFITLYREELKYQREMEERRAAEANRRAERFFDLMEKLIKK